MKEFPLPQIQSKVIGVGVSEAMSFTKVACGFDFIEYRKPEIDLQESLKWLTYSYEKKLNASDISISSEPGEMFGNPCLTAKVLCTLDKIRAEYHWLLIKRGGRLWIMTCSGRSGIVEEPWRIMLHGLAME